MTVLEIRNKAVPIAIENLCGVGFLAVERYVYGRTQRGTRNARVALFQIV